MSSTTPSSDPAAGPPLRYARWWAGLGVLALVAGVAVALRPGGGLLLASLGDKLNHALAFAFFTVWFGGVVPPGGMWRVALLLLGYGIAIEGAQALTPYRQAEFLDVGADASGILLGWGLSAAGLRHWCRWFEAWLVAPRSP
jgi:VanZ family protein